MMTGIEDSWRAKLRKPLAPPRIVHQRNRMRREYDIDADFDLRRAASITTLSDGSRSYQQAQPFGIVEEVLEPFNGEFTKVKIALVRGLLCSDCNKAIGCAKEVR